MQEWIFRIQILGNSIEKSQKESDYEMYFVSIVKGLRLGILLPLPFLLELNKIEMSSLEKIN